MGLGEQGEVALDEVWRPEGLEGGGVDGEGLVGAVAAQDDEGAGADGKG